MSTTLLPDLGMNERAWALADTGIGRAAELGLGIQVLASGARVIDAGVVTAGSLEAGKLLAELCMGGLGHVAFTTLMIGGDERPGVEVQTDRPAESCMASQYAGWAINPSGFFAMGSGPLRAKARVEKELFERLGYGEDAMRGVLVLEGRSLPTDAVAAWVSAKAGVAPDAVTLAIAPTASLAGGVQVVARSIETGLHKMDTLRFDVRRVVSATGTAPIPPVARNDIRAIGWTNDCVLYGGQVRYTVRASDEELGELAERLPSTTSPDYGLPFFEIFTKSGNDFYKIDPMLFSPAEVWLTSVESGRVFHAGRVNPEVLRVSFLEP